MLTIALHPLPPLPELEVLWRATKVGASHSFFLSWPWMHTWLASLPEEVRPLLLKVSDRDRVVGLAALVQRVVRRRLVSARIWAMNVAADDDLDRVHIEHNDLLALDTHRESAWRAWADHFVRQRGDWDEIALRGVSPAVLRHWVHPSIRVRTRKELQSRYTDLARVRSAGRPFVEQLGPNTRARLRRTKRALESRYGPVALQVARSGAEALEYLSELKRLHQTYWNSRGEQGAFGSEFLERFHSELIRNYFDEGVIQMIKLTAGETTVGLLYNFVYEGDVPMYQSGVDYSLVQSRNRESPGLLLHAMAIEHNASLGHRRYDFLAGEGQHKQALSSSSEPLFWGEIQRNRLKLRLEAGLRDLRQAVLRPRQA